MSWTTIVTRTSAPSQELPDVDMSVELGELALPNPVLTASGCAAAGRELSQFTDLGGLGALVTKSVMLAPQAGRPTPRMAETPSGLLNSIGLQGPGIDLFCERDLPWLAERGVRTVVSIAGTSVDEYAELAKRLGDTDGVAAVEVNISCPNVKHRGEVFACHAEPAGSVVAVVRRALPEQVPVLAKLSPDVTDIVEIARACVDGGADGLTLVNTLLGMAVDTRTLQPTLAGVTGGLSGAAIRPVAVRCVWEVHAALPEVPLVGVGGIRTGEDVLEFLAAGASAVQLGTVLFSDPSAPPRVLTELHRALAERGISRVQDVIGRAHRPGGHESPPAEAAAPEAPGPPAPDLVLQFEEAGGDEGPPPDPPDQPTAPAAQRTIVFDDFREGG